MLGEKVQHPHLGRKAVLGSVIFASGERVKLFLPLWLFIFSIMASSTCWKLFMSLLCNKLVWASKHASLQWRAAYCNSQTVVTNWFHRLRLKSYIYFLWNKSCNSARVASLRACISLEALQGSTMHGGTSLDCSLLEMCKHLHWNGLCFGVLWTCCRCCGLIPTCSGVKIIEWWACNFEPAPGV